MEAAAVVPVPGMRMYGQPRQDSSPGFGLSWSTVHVAGKKLKQTDCGS
jgi:hypothetical protein